MKNLTEIENKLDNEGRYIYISEVGINVSKSANKDCI